MSTQNILPMQTTAAEPPPQHVRFTDKCQQVGVGWLGFCCCFFVGFFFGREVGWGWFFTHVSVRLKKTKKI